MRPHDEWLSQGDVFAKVPSPRSNLKNGYVSFGTLEVPAVLLTDDCFLDDRATGKFPSVKRLSFAPLRSMPDQRYDDRKALAIRSGDANPPEPIYVNVGDAVDIGEDGEAIALLGETFMLPANYFRLEPITDPSDVSDSYRHRIFQTRTDTRVLTMEPAEKRLLQEKLSLFWTGYPLAPVCSTCWEPCVEHDGDWVHLGETDVSHLVTLTASHSAVLRRGAR